MFFPNDVRDNRAHIHIGKQGVLEYCKIWLEPDVSVDKVGTIQNIKGFRASIRKGRCSSYDAEKLKGKIVHCWDDDLFVDLGAFEELARFTD